METSINNQLWRIETWVGPSLIRNHGNIHKPVVEDWNLSWHISHKEPWQHSKTTSCGWLKLEVVVQSLMRNHGNIHKQPVVVDWNLSWPHLSWGTMVTSINNQLWLIETWVGHLSWGTMVTSINNQLWRIGTWVGPSLMRNHGNIHKQLVVVDWNLSWHISHLEPW